LAHISGGHNGLIYEIDYDADHYPIGNAGIYGRYAAGLPGVICDSCGVTWASSGYKYPQVRQEHLRGLGDFSRRRPVSVPVFNLMRDSVAPLLPPGTPLAPGTKFGVISGTLGIATDLSRLIGSYFLSATAYDRLKAEGIRLPRGHIANLVIKRTREPACMLELELPPTVRFAATQSRQTAPLPCNACGRLAIETPWDVTLLGQSIPRDIDMFRGYDGPNRVFVTNRFREAAEALGLTNITFREQRVTDI
jgi:uncharacterized double-CXXCG motif protein